MCGPLPPSLPLSLLDESVAVLNLHLGRVEHHVPCLVCRHLPDRPVPEKLRAGARPLFTRDRGNRIYGEGTESERREREGGRERGRGGRGRERERGRGRGGEDERGWCGICHWLLKHTPSHPSPQLRAPKKKPYNNTKTTCQVQ